MKGAKYSIYLDPESNLILNAVMEKLEVTNTSKMISNIIKEWAKNEGIEVEVIFKITGI